MPPASAIFVVDTHVHAQRHAMRFRETGASPDYTTLAKAMFLAEPYDNSPRLLYHMDRYQVDVAVIQPAFAMRNDIDLEIVDKHPTRFVALAGAQETLVRSIKGEASWNLDAALREVESALGTGRYAGIGEGIPYDPFPDRYVTWQERFEEITAFMELARRYAVPVQYHTGGLSGYGPGEPNFGRSDYDLGNPMLAHEVAGAFPDVPIILAHGGVQGWWGDRFFQECLHVAATHANVYLETGLWWPALYEQALSDPNIGCEKLVWGTDWGASIPQQWRPGQVPATYADQNRNDGPPAHQVDYYGWSLRQLDKLDIPQDDLNMVMGGNAVRLFRIDAPHTRLFKEYPFRGMDSSQPG